MGAPCGIGLIVFVGAIIRAFLGQVDIPSKVFARIGISAVKEAGGVVEALFVRAVHIPPGDVVPAVLGLQPEPDGCVICQRGGRFIVEKRVDQKNGKDIGRVLFLGKDRYAFDVDHGMAEFVIEDAQYIGLDKGIIGEGGFGGAKQEREQAFHVSAA